MRVNSKGGSHRSDRLFVSRAVLVFLGAVALAAPWSSLSADTVRVRGEITTAAELNPDYRGRPSPVNVILFQLTSADSFQNADFFSLYDPETEVLGGDLIQRTQIFLQPGEVREFEEEFDEEARYIGVVAAFRDIENAQWRGLIEMPRRGFIRNFFSKSRIYIEVEPLTVSISME